MLKSTSWLAQVRLCTHAGRHSFHTQTITVQCQKRPYKSRNNSTATWMVLYRVSSQKNIHDRWNQLSPWGDLLNSLSTGLPSAVCMFPVSSLECQSHSYHMGLLTSVYCVLHFLGSSSQIFLYTGPALSLSLKVVKIWECAVCERKSWAFHCIWKLSWWWKWSRSHIGDFTLKDNWQK